MARAATPVLSLVLVALVALALVAHNDERTRSFTLPVGAVEPVAKLFPGQTACQRPLVAQEDFEIVRVDLAAAGSARLNVAVARPGRAGRPFAARRVTVSGAQSPVRIDFAKTIPQERRFELCVTNESGAVAGVYGSEARIEDLSAVAGDTAKENSDMALTFLRSRPNSALSEVPEMFERAALFKPDFVGAWTFWLLLAGVGLGVPALLVAALRDVSDS